MKTGSLFKGLGLLLALNFLVKPAWIFLIDREVQNQLGHEVYGSYFALFNLSLIFSFFADAGLSNLMNRQLAANPAQRINPYLKLKLALSLVYIFLMMTAAAMLDFEQTSLLFYLVGIHLGSSFFLFLRNIITARQQFLTDSWLSVIDKLLVILMASGFIYWPAVFGTISLELFLQVQLAANLFALSAALVILARNKTATLPGSADAVSILKKALPFAVLIVLMTIHSRADGFLLKQIHPEGSLQSGIYALGFRLTDAGNMIGYLTASFLVPFLARHHNDRLVTAKAVEQGRDLLMLAAVFILGLAIAFPGWLQQLLYHSNEPAYSRVIRNCLAVLPAYFIIHIYGSLLTALFRIRMFIRILLPAVFLNLVLNAFFIPAWGAEGASIAALISQYALAAVLFLAASRIFQLAVPVKKVVYYVLAALAFTALLVLAQMAIKNVWLILALAAAIFLIALLVWIKKVKPFYLQ